MAEGVDLRDDGTAALDLSGERYVLRRPTIGEWRKLQELIATADATFTEARSTMPTLLALTDSDAYIAWLREVVLMLHGGTLPPSDDLPAWTMMPTVARDLIAHWTTVPLVHGSSSTASTRVR